ncbi:MAG TPA: L,D-transpeptidase [Solirubrobacteraceae bacterium]|jgi:lipoprotein-anchoring transpeptidase ErfK/SrfK
MRPRALAVAAVVFLASLVVGLVGSAALFGGDGPRGGTRKASGHLAGLPGAKLQRGTRFSSRALRGVPRGASVVATARGHTVLVHRHRGGRADRRLTQRRTSSGRRLPLVFLVKARRKGWLKVHLPTRPNLGTGWLRASRVRLTITRFRLRVDLRSHRLTVLRNGRRVMRTAIGTGRSTSPTPTGRYYVTDLLRTGDPAGFYGPFALGLSAHSPVYTSFAGGDGQVGLHGTNNPSVLGTDVSHGCIRLSNEAITRLAKRIPLGTPVDIRRG